MWLEGHTDMDPSEYPRFYKALFAPLEGRIGPIDPKTIVALIGFDLGGPLNFCTIGAERKGQPVTYVSCELAVRPEQVPAKDGQFRYELLTSCDDERWVRSVLTALGRMSMSVAFDRGHTVDIAAVISKELGPSGGDPSPIQGVLFTFAAGVEFEGGRYGVLRCIGITRPEMDLCRSKGAVAVMDRLKNAGVWPHTLVRRASTV